jgi:RimJ/RimL family protein N-acetyltransferase
MEMTTKRLILRSWEENDAADLYALASDPQIGSGRQRAGRHTNR